MDSDPLLRKYIKYCTDITDCECLLQLQRFFFMVLSATENSRRSESCEQIQFGKIGGFECRCYVAVLHFAGRVFDAVPTAGNRRYRPPGWHVGRRFAAITGCVTVYPGAGGRIGRGTDLCRQVLRHGSYRGAYQCGLGHAAYRICNRRRVGSLSPLRGVEWFYARRPVEFDRSRFLAVLERDQAVTRVPIARFRSGAGRIPHRPQAAASPDRACPEFIPICGRGISCPKRRNKSP